MKAVLIVSILIGAISAHGKKGQEPASAKANTCGKRIEVSLFSNTKPSKVSKKVQRENGRDARLANQKE